MQRLTVNVDDRYVAKITSQDNLVVNILVVLYDILAIVVVLQ